MKKNILANFIGRFWGILSNFLFIPLYIHFLGFESYSVISFTLIIAGIMAILDAGLTATLSREFARTDNTNEEKLKIFGTLEIIYLVIVGVCTLIIFSFSTLVAERWLHPKSYTPDQVSFFLKIISFDIGFQLLLRFYMGGLLGLEKQVKANLYQVGWGMMRNGLVVVAIMIYRDLQVFFFWQSISTVIFALLMKLSLEKELSGKYRIHFSSKVDKLVFINIKQFAGGMMLIAIVSALNTQMDKIAISRFLSLESLGYYTLAISLSQGIVVLVNPIATALLPRFTAQYTSGRNEEASLLFNRVGLLVSILVFAISTNMIFCANKLIWIWTGQVELADKVSTFLPVIAISMSMLALANLSYHVAIANGYTKLNNFLGLISLLITLPGYWIATKYYGAMGAALVFCVVQAITTFVYMYFINKKFIKVNLFRDIYFKQIILPFVLSLSVAYFFSRIPSFSVNSRIISLLWIGISTGFTLIVTAIILIPIKEIKSVLKFRN